MQMDILPIMLNTSCVFWLFLFRLSGFFDAISQVAKFARRWDDDYIDRLNHRFTTLMLVVMTVVVSYKQYVGEPIVCWTEGQWTGTHMCCYYHGLKWP